VALVFAFYFPALGAGFVWDDDKYVTENPLLTEPDGWKQIWFSAHTQSQYFPLVYSTFRLEHALWGLHPLGYHLVNVVLHGANAVLVWAVLRRLAVPAAWLGAAIFALHPVQVESVAWVTELKNLESTFFYLLAVLAWMRFVDLPVVSGQWSVVSGPVKYYFLALGAYVLALFAKTTACTLPAALVVVLWLKSTVHPPSLGSFGGAGSPQSTAAWLRRWSLVTPDWSLDLVQSSRDPAVCPFRRRDGFGIDMVGGEPGHLQRRDKAVLHSVAAGADSQPGTLFLCGQAFLARQSGL